MRGGPIRIALLGLFVPSPSWPGKSLGSILLHPRQLARQLTPALVFATLAAAVAGVVVIWLPVILALAVVLALPGLLVWRLSGQHASTAARELEELEDAAARANWNTEPDLFYSTATQCGLANRKSAAEAIILSARSKLSPKLAKGREGPKVESSRPPNGGDGNGGGGNGALGGYLKEVKGLAVYGCGILAATHVGGLRALEDHGLDYEQIETLAGVSAGAILVALLAVGQGPKRADGIMDDVMDMPLADIALPELGSVMRASAACLSGLVKSVGGNQQFVDKSALGDGTGPGLNAGTVLSNMIGDALEKRTGDREITLAQVEARYGKRLVIVSTELDSGREAMLTASWPEDVCGPKPAAALLCPHLPLRIAVRMSMGIPGIMEPVRYQGHVYVDGGMTDDFPIDALPPQGRLGLMVRPMEWMVYNTARAVHEIVGPQVLASAPRLKAELESMQGRLRQAGVYPVKDPVSLMTTSINVMMDANLMLQIRLDQLRRQVTKLEANQAAQQRQQNKQQQQQQQQAGSEAGSEAPAAGEEPVGAGGLSELAPQVLTLCGGALDPFDFNLGKDQHRDLFYAGQISVHIHASQLEKAWGKPANGAAAQPTEPLLSDSEALRAILWLLYLKAPLASRKGLLGKAKAF